MKKHLYDSKLMGKVVWFVGRFGARELFLKPARVISAPFILPLLSKRVFVFDGMELEHFYHAYNMTWASERCVEIPIARSYLGQFQRGSVLEVGNVLSHYGPVSHDVVDKFEKGPGVINDDIVTFAPHRRYDLILAISTFEHIGFDDESSEPSGQKIQAAIAACRKLLAPDGRLVITVPIGYNPDLDRMIAAGDLQFDQELYLKRVGRREWRMAPKAEALKCRYRKPFPYANAILVAHFRSCPERTGSHPS